MQCLFVVIQRPTNMVKLVRADYAIAVCTATKLLVRPLIPFYYRRQISPETIQTILQSYAEGSSLRGLSRITGVAYNMCVSVVHSASHKAQLIHNGQVQAVSTDVINADELWSFVKKSKNTVDQMS